MKSNLLLSFRSHCYTVEPPSKSFSWSCKFFYIEIPVLPSVRILFSFFQNFLSFAWFLPFFFLVLSLSLSSFFPLLLFHFFLSSLFLSGGPRIVWVHLCCGPLYFLARSPYVYRFISQDVEMWNRNKDNASIITDAFNILVLIKRSFNCLCSPFWCHCIGL